MLNAIITKSYYLIQEGSHENTFQLTEDGTTVIITVPVGLYLLSAFKTTIATLLSNASPNGLTYTVTYPSLAGPDTEKWTFTQTNGAIISSLLFDQHLFEPFGFLPGSTNQFNGTTLTSTCVIKLQSEDRLLIHSNIVSNGRDDILVSMNSSTLINYSSINYVCPAPFFNKILDQHQAESYDK